MGKLRTEVLSLIEQFISNEQKSDEKTFHHHLKILHQKLSQLLNQDEYIIIHTDGSSKGNPGPAKIGIQFKNNADTIILRESKEIGIKTNNQAEYSAILEALILAREKNYKKVKLYSDSQVVINQLNNIYKIKDARLKDYYQQIKKLLSEFDDVQFIYVKREFNKTADVLSN